LAPRVRNWLPNLISILGAITGPNSHELKYYYYFSLVLTITYGKAIGTNFRGCTNRIAWFEFNFGLNSWCKVGLALVRAPSLDQKTDFFWIWDWCIFVIWEVTHPQTSHNISVYLVFILRLRRYINASSLSFFRSSVSRCKIPLFPLLDMGLFFFPKVWRVPEQLPSIGQWSIFRYKII